MKRVGWSILVLLAVGCHRGEEVQRSAVAAPPPAVVLTSALESLGLEERLALLDRELAEGEARGEVDEHAIARFFRAEAITDRLLESNVPYPWLAEGYDLESRLRQIQSLADRVIAQIRRGATEEEILADVAGLRRQVAALRRAMGEGGGEAPPSLDALLAGVQADSIRAVVTEGATGE